MNKRESQPILWRIPKSRETKDQQLDRKWNKT